MKLLGLMLALIAQQMSGQIGPSGAQVNPHSNLPAQRIQPNDLIWLEVYRSPELTRTVRVSKDGTIVLPLLRHPISVEGLMPVDAEDAIASALKKEDVIVDPVVTVALAEYHQNKPISVVGAVKTPLTFQADGKVTLLDAISRAGGLTPQAGPEILISHGQREETDTPAVLARRVSVKDLIEKADPESNVILAGGEEIRVPEVGNVFVLGNVKRPGAFPVHYGPQGTTVLKVLALSEGLLPNSKNQAFIYRREGGAASKNEIPIELDKILKAKAPDVPLMAEDILYIPDNSGRREALAVLEKVILLGSGAIGGITYAAIAH